MARRLAAVSLEKNGLPMQRRRLHTPLFQVAHGPAANYGSANWFM